MQSHQFSPHPHGQQTSPGSAASRGCRGLQPCCAAAPEPRGGGAHPCCPSSASPPAPVGTTAECETQPGYYSTPPRSRLDPPQLSPKPLDPLMLRLPQTELTQAPILLPSLVPHPLAKKPNRLGPHGHIPTPRPAPPPLPLPTTLSQRSGPAPVPPQPSPPPCAAGGAAAPGAAGPPC